MSKAKALLRAGCIGCLLLAFTLGCYASDSDRITELEKQVQELKARLSNLEAPQGNTSTRPKSVVSSNGWTVLGNWRTLKQGMSYDEVRATLGEPARIAGGTIAQWYYPNQGRVTFYESKLDNWTEPR